MERPCKTSYELILAGANVNARAGYFQGETPLHYATNINARDITIMLLLHGAIPPHNLTTDDEQISTMLLRYSKEQIDERDGSQTARHRAAEGSHPGAKHYGASGSQKQQSALIELRRLYRKYNGNLEAMRGTISGKNRNTPLYWLGDEVEQPVVLPKEGKLSHWFS